MTVFIAAMLAVLLAEIGKSSAMIVHASRHALFASALGVAVGTAAFAGLGMASAMTVHARSLVLAVAFFLTGAGQFGRNNAAAVPVSVRDTLLLVWRSGAPFLAFAFSVWKAAPVGAAAGALAGAASAIGAGLLFDSRILQAARRGSGALLIAFALYTALRALRLI